MLLTAAITAALTLLGSAVLSLFILAHAFRRSVGTGVITLCVPFYVLYYAFSQFEHARKGPILAGWLGLGALGSVLVSGVATLARG